MSPDREKELIERIQVLEELNSVLQDKLDAIYQIVAPEDFDVEDEIDESPGLVNIEPQGKQRKQ